MYQINVTINDSIFKPITNTIACQDWCQSEIDKLIILTDYNGFILIILSIIILISLIYPWPEEFEKYKLSGLWFVIYLLIGFLILRMWFN